MVLQRALLAAGLRHRGRFPSQSFEVACEAIRRTAQSGAKNGKDRAPEKEDATVFGGETRMPDVETKTSSAWKVI